MSIHKSIPIADFDYFLPADSIAQYPSDKRSESKLLLATNGEISQHSFNELPQLIPSGSHLFMNDTEVIPARIIMNKPTGGQVELFLLEPLWGSNHFDSALSKKGTTEWHCLVGGSKKWKEGILSIEIQKDETTTRFIAQRLEQKQDFSVIRFEWSPISFTFSEIIEAFGEVPLPPYFHRPAEAFDRERYQTVFAKSGGSVAAPTAGLHFTKELIEEIKKKRVSVDYLTLHVGAGTFKPVTSETIGTHAMHSEYFEVKLSTLKNIYRAIDDRIIAVGTTSCRTMESLYWLGLKQFKSSNDVGSVNQWDPYELSAELTPGQALEILIEKLERNGQEKLKVNTSIMIVPGYSFQLVNGLLTNFHLPKSTLLLLVSALVGDRWKEIYNYALKNDFRFLSYGDASLLLP